MRSDLVIDSLCKSYGPIEALKGVSLRVHSGEIVALLGNNGAGKSTLMNIAAGLVRADSGTVEVLGEQVRGPAGRAGGSGASSSQLGLAPQSEALYPTLTVAQNLEYFGRLAGLDATTLRTRVREVAQDLLIDDLLDRQARDLSGGQRRRLHTGLALMHAPQVLLLDEPTVGVDIESRLELLEFIRRTASSGAAILYSTHQLHEVEQLADHVVIIDHGKVRARGRVQDIIDTHAPALVELSFDREVHLGPVWEARIDRKSSHPGGQTRVTVQLNDARLHISEIIGQLPDGAGELLMGAMVLPPSLEQAYLRITRDGEPDGEPAAPRAGSGSVRSSSASSGPSTSTASAARGPRPAGTIRIPLVVARNEVALFRREYIPLILYFVMPLAILAFVQGAFDLFLHVVEPTSTSNGADLAAPGQATMFGFMSLASLGHFFLGEHGWGTWNRVRSLGVRPWQIMGGKLGVDYVQQILLFSFVMSAGALLFGLSVSGSVAALVLVELVTAATIVGYGLVICALATTQAQFNAFAYLGALVMAGVGGALTPFSTLPSWAQDIAPAFPTYWAVRGFQKVMIRGSGIAGVSRELVVLAFYAAALLLVGGWLFDADRRRSTWA